MLVSLLSQMNKILMARVVELERGFTVAEAQAAKTTILLGQVQ